jgi:hypothetical protein
MQNFNKFILLLLLVSCNLFAKDCVELKKTILSDSIYLDPDIKELQKGIESNNECMKNLFGIMLYNGLYFSQDQSRAESIFYDLSNKNYPEAQFNFALAMTKRTDQDPHVVINLISGIFFKYAEDKQSSYLSSLARDLGRKYTESLLSLTNKCKENKNSFNQCNPVLRSISADDIDNISSKYEDAIRDAQSIIANNRVKLHAESKDQADTLVAILSIGIMAYNLSSAAAPPNNATPYNPYKFGDPNVINNPWLNGNPLKQNLYQWPRPF